MNDAHEQPDDIEPWISLSNWEQQCVEEVEKTPDIEVEIQTEKDYAVQKLWFLFENAATCIAQLYKERQHGISLWLPFQAAATSVTTLYKECVESHKRLFDMGQQCGYQRRNKDLLSWAKKRRRQINREELFACLTGRSPPPPQRHWGHPRPRLSLDGVRSVPHLTHSHRFPNMEPSGLLSSTAEEPNFEIFREALGFSPLRQHSTGSPTSSFTRMHRARHLNPTSTSHTELSAYITEEYSRHSDSRKRSPSTDVIMDSPTHKRSRLT